jgi:ketosteroid isomerase-like protein
LGQLFYSLCIQPFEKIAYSIFISFWFLENLYLPVIKIFPPKNVFMKQLLTTLAIFSITSLVFAACNDKEAPATKEDIKPTFDIAGAKKAIDSTNAKFGEYLGKSDSVGLASLYTSDAKLMGPNMPVASGRSNIQSTFGGMFAALGKVGITLTASEVQGTEELVSEVGTYVMTDKDGKETEKGKYIVLWKMEDGKWKLYRDCWNADAPPGK